MSIMSKECYYKLAPDLTICRIVNGMWQVAGGHGYIYYELAIEDMIRYHEAGFTSWDLADIYGPAEEVQQYAPMFRYIFVPVLVLSGLCMWKGDAVVRLFSKKSA